MKQQTAKPLETFLKGAHDPKHPFMVLQPQWQTPPGPAPQREKWDCPTYMPKEQEGKEKRQPPPHPGLKSFWKRLTEKAESEHVTARTRAAALPPTPPHKGCSCPALQ